MAIPKRPKEIAGRSPLVIAHRGASGLAPENTLAAFKLALAMGADGIEMDIQLSADGQAVVIHDKRVDRTTNGAGRVSKFTADELNQLDASARFERRLERRPRLRARAQQAAALAGSDFFNEPVPTLASTLALLAPARLARIYIELKGEPGNKQALLEQTVALVRDFRLQRAITLLSFDRKIIGRAKALAPEIRTAATFSLARHRLAAARSIIRSVEEVAADEAALHFGLATRRTVAALKDRGISVSAWTANSKLIMRSLVACGVDSIMTNFPDQLINTLKKREPGRFTASNRGLQNRRGEPR